MTDFPKWPHLENLDRVLAEYDPNFLADPCGRSYWVVTEKIHGFNARFGLTLDGEPWVGSRNLVTHKGDPASWPAKDLQGFVGFAASKVVLLDRGETLFGEWAGKGVQKGIDYGEKDFYLFGSCYEDAWGGKTQVRWDDPELVGIVSRITGCKTVPVLGQFTEPPTLEWLTAQRDAKSLLADQTREGVVVVKWPIPFSPYGSPVIAKFKSAAFREVSYEPRAAKELPDMEQIMSLVSRYATPQRLEHVLWQVRLENDLRDIDSPLLPEYTGHVMRGMHDDIVREAGSEFTDLSGDAQKAFGKALNPTAKRLLADARMAQAVAV